MRMATYFDKVEEFRPESETVVAYLESVHFLAANDIAGEEKDLSTVGRKICFCLCDLLAHVKLQEKTMQQITIVFKSHFQPKPLVLVERFLIDAISC